MRVSALLEKKMDGQFPDYQVWQILKDFAKMAGVYEGMAPKSFLQVLEESEPLLDRRDFGCLGIRDIPKLVEVANWDAFQENFNSHGEMTTPRPQEIDVHSVENEYGTFRFALEYGGGRSVVRAEIFRVDFSDPTVLLSINTWDEEIVKRCIDNWEDSKSEIEENRRAIQPLRDEFGPRFDAGGYWWEDRSDSDVVFDTSEM